MAERSHIEWTDATWNPATGCTKTSPGCAHCYAESFARRLRGAGNKHYARGFEPIVHRDVLDAPLRWRKPRHVFVCSMGDLFHDKVPTEFIIRVFKTMAAARRHVFQVLTKRSSRLAELAPRLPWPPNVWAGVSIESESYLPRLRDLLKVPAAVRFLSLEPLLGPIPGLQLKGIHWVIVGGESGPRARPMKKTWVRQIRATCRRGGVPFFFKQWGGRNKKAAGRTLDARTWDERPAMSVSLAGAQGTAAGS